MIGARELRADLARHLHRAAAGERVEVAVAGRPAVAIVPLAHAAGDSGTATLEALVAAGALVPPRRATASRERPPIPVYTGARLDRLLGELRG
ncbi:MAG: type II toxin-antitoxin system prevent-host-death family antitoxin [Ilumatobacteraceae bacterium]